MKVNKKYKSSFHFDGRYLIEYGGAGSGKSRFIAQKWYSRLTGENNHKILALRKVKTTLKESVYSEMLKVINSEENTEDFIIKVSPMEIIYKPNGNKMLFFGLDDVEKLKSIEGITSIWIEEATELDEVDFRQVNLRLRGETENYKQIILSFNPIDEDHWLKNWIDSLPKDNSLVVHSTFEDNKYIDEEYKEVLENLINEDDNYYNIYRLGKWGVLNIVGRAYKKFSSKNIVKYEYNPQAPIIVCCDFNVAPMKWALIQNIKGIDFVFDEVVKDDTDTEEMVKELLNRYGNAPYIVYGDYSGTFRTTQTRSTDYDIIRQYLPAAPINIKPNPLVVNRVNAVNWRLSNKEEIIRFFVDENCSHTIKDLRRVKFKEGTKELDKKDINLTHISDAIGYYIEYEYSLKGKPTISLGKMQ